MRCCQRWLVVIAWSQANPRAADPGGQQLPQLSSGCWGDAGAPRRDTRAVFGWRGGAVQNRGTGLAVPGDALCHLLSPGRVTGPALGWPWGRLSGQGWTLSSFCQSFVKLPPCSSRRFFSSAGWEGCVGSEAAPEIILRVRGASGAAGRLLSPCPGSSPRPQHPGAQGSSFYLFVPPSSTSSSSLPLFPFPLLHFPPR